MGGKSKSLGGMTSLSLIGGMAKPELAGALLAPASFVEGFPTALISSKAEGFERSGPKSKGGGCMPSISPLTESNFLTAFC